MRFTIVPGRIAPFLLVTGLLAMASSPAFAVPSFARQTGLSCSTCHTVFPQLTPFGRHFKMNGYTLATQTTQNSPGLEINKYPPLSAMVMVSDTILRDAQPDSSGTGQAQNSTIAFPDQLSVFYAGRVSDHIGAFTQITYDGQSDHFTLDNTDLRFAWNDTLGGKSLTYGITVNNAPTVQDVWNSTPVWGFPYTGSESAPAPAAATQLDGTLGQQVAGVGFYAFWNDSIYAEFTGYRSAQVGGAQPNDSQNADVISGIAPYWRVAWEHDWSDQNLEVGLYGLSDHLYPGAGMPLVGPTNDFRDTGVDIQYQYLGGDHTMTLHSTYIHEHQDLAAAFATKDSANPSNTLNTFKLDGEYYYQREIGGSLGYFSTTGTSDAGLYAPNPVDGSATGSPDSRGWIAEFDYLPTLNVKLVAQYVMYSKFNGASSNYDGFGRSASDNDTLYLNLWILF